MKKNNDEFQYELKEKILKVSMPTEMEKATNPEQVAQLARKVLKEKSDQKEHFLCLHQNGKNDVVSVDHVSMGTQSASLVHPREVFRQAIISGALSVSFAHNHPSGDPTPSQEDIEMTERLVECGEILGIEVHDHVIVAGDDFRSFHKLNLID